MMDVTIDDIRIEICNRLGQAVRDRNAAMHTPVVATADADARIMVLRSFDPEDWTLRFHTDARAPKVGVIERDPRVAVLAYGRDAKLQLRLRGTGKIAREGAEVDSAWAESTNFARRCYLGAGPGVPSAVPTTGLPLEHQNGEPSDEDLLPARENFAILKVAIEEADWYWLSAKGHRRALVTPSGGKWLTP